MPAMDLTTPFDPRIDRLSKKIQEIRERTGQEQGEALDATMDDAMDVVEQNLGRQEAREAEMSLNSLGDELSGQMDAMHHLDPAKVADLISDPFED